MRKNIITTILFAIVAITIITSCKKEDKYACEKAEFIGTYTGSHSLNINEPTPASIPINDTIIIRDTTGTDSLSITSKTLGVTLKGRLSDCRVTIPSASIEEFQYTIGGLFGTATIKNVVATLTIRKNLTKNKIETTIAVSEGTASTDGAISLNNQSIADTELTGNFR